MKVWLQLYDGRALSGSIPKRVACTIKEIHASTKGPTVTPRYGPKTSKRMFTHIVVF